MDDQSYQLNQLFGHNTLGALGTWDPHVTHHFDIRAGITAQAPLKLVYSPF